MIFRDKLKNGKFIITAEVAPPRGSDFESEIKKIEPLKGHVDAFNVTDNQRSMVRMSSLVMSKLLKDRGFEPICQFTARDRNRIAIQSDLLGAAAFGIENICLMTGDFTTLGDEPGAKPVFDVDSIQLIRIAKTLKEGKLINGKEISGKISFNIGAVYNPFSGPKKLQLLKLKRKIEEGAEFIQTQPIYDTSLAREINELILSLGAVPIIGLLPIKSLRMANFMKKINPRSIPKKLIEGLENANDPYTYGWEFTIDLARCIAEFGRGIHFMLVGKTYELAKFISELKNGPLNHKF